MPPTTRERGASLFQLLDLRHSLRLLRRSPAFTVLTVSVLAGGLGLAIFTFSFLYTAMLKPLPLANGERIVRVSQQTLNSSGGIDAAELALMRPDIKSLNAVSAYTSRNGVLGDAEHPRPLRVIVTEANMFAATRSAPMLGRVLQKSDQAVGAEPAIVLSFTTWTAAFGGDSAIVGQTVALDGAPVRVVGVMPDGYGFPVVGSAWMALSDTVIEARTRNLAALDMWGQLAPGATRDQATTELNVLLSRARAAVPLVSDKPLPPTRLTVETFQMAQMGEEGPILFVVLNVLAVLILLLACINVINLLLARANERARETAVRLALGASRARLIMQNMWESIFLCVAGGALATLLAAWGLDTINALARANLPGNLAFWWVWHLDRAGLLAAAAFVTATMATLGGVVAARASNQQFNSVLSDGGARSGGRRQDRVARWLVVGQVATVSVLMFFGVMSGIVANRLATADFGYDTRNLLRTSVELPEARYSTAEQRSNYFDAALDGLERAAPIESVVLKARIGDIDSEDGRFTIEGHDAALQPRAYVQAAFGSLATAGATLTAGRSFDPRHAAPGRRAALGSRSLAAKDTAGRSPSGGSGPACRSGSGKRAPRLARCARA